MSNTCSNAEDLMNNNAANTVTLQELIGVGEHVIVDHTFEENRITDNILNITRLQENTIYIHTLVSMFCSYRFILFL